MCVSGTFTPINQTKYFISIIVSTGTIQNKGNRVMIKCTQTRLHIAIHLTIIFIDIIITIIVFNFILIGKVRPKIQTLLDSLTELSKLLYLPAQSCSPKLVLRLHNQAFIHAMICKEVIGQPKSLTSR